jgi:hypothetical protein
MHDDEVEKQIKGLRLAQPGAAFLTALQGRVQAELQRRNSPAPAGKLEWRGWLNLGLSFALALLWFWPHGPGAVLAPAPSELTQVEPLRQVYGNLALRTWTARPNRPFPSMDAIFPAPSQTSPRRPHSNAPEGHVESPPDHHRSVFVVHGDVAVVWHPL